MMSLLLSSGTVHMTQTDAPFVLPPSLYRGGGGLYPVTAYQVNGSLSLSFLKRHLIKGTHSSCTDYEWPMPCDCINECSKEQLPSSMFELL